MEREEGDEEGVEADADGAATSVVVSDSCLFYLFADRLIPTERAVSHALGEIAVPVPSSNRLVPLGNLERHLLAVAVLSLESLGAVEVRYDGQSHPRGFWLRRSGDIDHRDGLEARLLGLLPPEPVRLWDLLLVHWMGRRSFPLNAVLVEVQVEAMRAGCIDRPATPEIIPGFLGNHTFPAVPVYVDAIDRLGPELEILAARWRHAAGAGDRVAKLLRECNQALYDARPGNGPIWNL